MVDGTGISQIIQRLGEITPGLEHLNSWQMGITIILLMTTATNGRGLAHTLMAVVNTLRLADARCAGKQQRSFYRKGGVVNEPMPLLRFAGR